MSELRIGVDCIAMAAAVFANIEHRCPSQIADQAPDRTVGQGHRFSDVICRAVWIRSHVKDNGAVARNEIEASDGAPLLGLTRITTPAQERNRPIADLLFKFRGRRSVVADPAGLAGNPVEVFEREHSP